MWILKILQNFHKYRLKELYVEIFEQKAKKSTKIKPESLTVEFGFCFLFENFQIFDLDGLIGRYLSCSYAYDSEHPDYEKAMLEIKNIFRTYQENGQIKMWYNTELYHGYLK